MASDKSIIITPGPGLLDNSQLEKTCSQYCDRLRKKGVTGLACTFTHAPPHRPNPIPQVLQNLMQYKHAVFDAQDGKTCDYAADTDDSHPLYDANFGFQAGRTTSESDDLVLEAETVPHNTNARLIEVLRKVATSIATDRMRRDWNRMHLLDDANPGFQAGRTTVNSILPLRLAAENCVATKQHFAALLGDLKWCFDTPARTIVELALMRLGVPSYYYEMLEDIDLHSAKTTVTAA